jgi:DNA-binding response OmpR family regulator
VEDDPAVKKEYIEFLTKHSGYAVRDTTDKQEALKIIKEWSPHVLLIHFTEDFFSSIGLIEETTKIDSTVCPIYTTDFNQPEKFVKAMKAGAFGALNKPFVMDELEIIVEKAFEESVRRKNLLLARSYVFVLMPFDKEFKEIYQLAIKEPLVHKGLYCERADEVQSVGGIMEQVYSRIKRARFIVADMTGRNPNVYYEVGYAHAIGKDVILLTQETEDIPFDLRGYRHIVH